MERVYFLSLASLVLSSACPVRWLAQALLCVYLLDAMQSMFTFTSKNALNTQQMKGIWNKYRIEGSVFSKLLVLLLISGVLRKRDIA